MSNAKMNSSVLVTGGAGFVGSHLCARLVAEGHRVFCLDNFYTGKSENIQSLLSSSRFELIEKEVGDSIDLQVDQIYNLASPASPKHYQRDPLVTLETNIDGSRNMLDLAVKNGARILQASTSEVYGDPLVHPQIENYWGNVNPIGARACYDEGKRCAETFFFEYERLFGLDIRVARIFNTYGPNMQLDDGRVVSNFIVQAIKGEDLTVYGDGSQTRSFQFVDDLVEGLYRLMNSDTAVSGPVNLGNPIEKTILEFAEGVLKHFPKSPSKIIFQPLPEDDPKKRRPDISKAKNLLSWEPKVPLEQGLKRTAEYFTSMIE